MFHANTADVSRHVKRAQYLQKRSAWADYLGDRGFDAHHCRWSVIQNNR
jgi:hypothetical protein